MKKRKMESGKRKMWILKSADLLLIDKTSVAGIFCKENMRHAAKITILLFILITATGIGRSQTATRLPNPVLYLTGYEFVTPPGGKEFIRYKFAVENSDAFPKELFAASPELPPCGKNTNASRTWVDFYDQYGKRLYGFCALGEPAGLNSIWFALESTVIPPSWVYVEFTDRKTGTKYKSNLAETTL